MADEFIQVTKGLWDSWEDGAFVRNKETGQFIDPAKLHRVDYKGEFYSVQGPLNISRSRQGRPVLIQAGSSETGKSFAAKVADAVFTGQANRSDAVMFSKDVKERAAAAGRDPAGVLVLPGCSPIVGRTAAEAEAKYRGNRRPRGDERRPELLGPVFQRYRFHPVRTRRSRFLISATLAATAGRAPRTTSNRRPVRKV